jgi:hypothetical protein
MSLSKSFPLGKARKFEVRVDALNALNHTQYTGVNNTVNFSSGAPNATVTNPPVNANGTLNFGGFGAVTGARLPRQIQIMTRLVF